MNNNPRDTAPSVPSHTHPKEGSMSSKTAQYLVAVSDDSLTVEKVDIAPESLEEGQYLVTEVADLDNIPTDIKLRIFNRTRAKASLKFPSKAAANEMTFEAIKVLGSGKTRTTTEPTAKAPKAAKEKAPKVAKLVSYPATELKAARKGSKVALMIDLLSQEGGVELTELENQLSKTGKAVNVRSWIGYDLHKMHGYGVRSEHNDKGQVICFLVLPKGVKAPLEHKVPEPPKAKEPKAPKAEAKPETELSKAVKASKANKAKAAKTE